MPCTCMLRSPDSPCMVTYCDHDQWLSIQFITGFSSFFPTIIVPIYRQFKRDMHFEFFILN